MTPTEAVHLFIWDDDANRSGNVHPDVVDIAEPILAQACKNLYDAGALAAPPSTCKSAVEYMAQATHAQKQDIHAEALRVIESKADDGPNYEADEQPGEEPSEETVEQPPVDEDEKGGEAEEEPGNEGSDSEEQQEQPPQEDAPPTTPVEDDAGSRQSRRRAKRTRSATN